MTVRVLIKRDTSGLDSRFEIFDAGGEPKYTVRGKHTPSGESIRIRDIDGNIVCRIRRLGIGSLGAYTVTAGNETIRLNIAFSAGTAAVRFHGISFMVRGDAASGNYDIVDADRSLVCAVSRDFAKRTLILTIDVEERALFCIAAAICIDSLSPEVSPVFQMV